MHCLKQTFRLVFSNHPADDDLKGQSIAIAKADIPIESNRLFCLPSFLLVKPSSGKYSTKIYVEAKLNRTERPSLSSVEEAWDHSLGGRLQHSA
jgi:hypothetical protein